jgi:hypothetical protein
VPLYRDSKYEALYQDTLKIQEALKNWNNAEAKKILVQSIITERQFIEKEKEFYALAIKKSFEIIDKKFNEIWWDRSELPDKSKIHIVWAYEFRWQKGWYQPNLLWFCSYMNGELFINRDALFYSWSWKLGVENDQFVEKRLIHTITHEIIHWVSTANYRHQYKDENKLWKEDTNNIYPSARRLWNQMRRFIRNKDKSITIKERWRALNEGITETLTRDIIKSELSIDAPSNCYPDERDVLNTLCKAYTIDIKDFYKVIINRKNSLKVVNKKLEQKALWNKTIKTPSFYTLLISVMDYEYSQDKWYKNTKALINWEQLVITPEMKKFFHPSLLESWIFKEKFQKAYPNILDSESKAIAA